MSLFIVGKGSTMAVPASQDHFQTLFENAPISLWEEDYSGIKHLFDGLRQKGVGSLETYLETHPDFADACMRQMKLVHVNQQTLDMLKAASQEQLESRLDQVFRDGMRPHFRAELLALWAGQLLWSGEGINYTLDGQPLDILLHWRILPGFEQTWESVLVTIENITARKQAERRLQSLFDASPISLWEEDYSAVKAYFETLRSSGVTDLQSHLEQHPEVVTASMGLIKVLNVNQKTLELFRADSKEHLLAHLDQVFRDEMGLHFSQELVDLWNGKLAYERDGINYALDGELLNIHLDFRVMPGHVDDFSWVMVAILDVTARNKAEDYLRYLGTHDVMTRMYNRTFFEETLQRLEREPLDPVSILIADLNGLKEVNDKLGHQAGDALIRRAAEVLNACLEPGQTVARIGGDEFVIFLPGADAQAANEAIQRVQILVGLNNKFYRDPELSISVGAATRQPGLSLEKVISLADNAMYRSKSRHYHRRRNDTAI
jgi:diguanylate cyclase (GGDEF)-like protein